MTAYEKKTGWKYSITCTNIPLGGIAGVPGSHHPQYIDAVQRDHATVETDGVRTAKAMGLRNPARAQLTSASCPSNTKGDASRPRGSRCRPGHAGQHPAPPARTKTDMKPQNRPQHEKERATGCLTH
jgi:hypothetical protein